MNKAIVVVALTIGLTVLPAGSGQAQTAPATAQRPPVTASAPAPVREVYPHELMTFSERFEMWQKMRAARTMDERMEVWVQKYAELEKRAAEQGAVLRHDGPTMMDHGSYENRGQCWGGEGRMGIMGTQGGGGGGVHRPPMGW